MKEYRKETGRKIREVGEETRVRTLELGVRKGLTEKMVVE